MKGTASPQSASILDRLQNEAKRTGETFNAVLGRYVGFRLLYRLTKSRFADQFLLKGATMFLFWIGAMHRPTGDFDLLGMTADPEELKRLFMEITTVECAEDGVIFDAESVEAAVIREDQAYGGVRVTMLAFIGKARIPLQFDIGFGDAVTPEPDSVEIPAMIRDVPTATMPCYTVETSFAEKLEAMVRFELTNSRMKDFLDLATLIREEKVDNAVLRQAIQATFVRRKTKLPEGLPVALTEQFWTDPTVMTRWTAFVRKNLIKPPLDDLAILCDLIAKTVEPILCPET